MGNIRRFTKEDWYGYAGAEKFKSGAEPFIYNQELNDGLVRLTVIADKSGIQIEMAISDNNNDVTWIDDDEDIAWIRQMDLNPIKAEGELRALVKKLQNYTYAPDLSYALDHESEEEFRNFENIN